MNNPLTKLLEGDLKNYRVEKISGEMVITPNRKGHYRARYMDDIREMLTTGFCERTVYLRLNNKRPSWKPLRNSMPKNLIVEDTK